MNRRRFVRNALRVTSVLAPLVVAAHAFYLERHIAGGLSVSVAAVNAAVQFWRSFPVRTGRKRPPLVIKTKEPSDG